MEIGGNSIPAYDHSLNLRVGMDTYITYNTMIELKIQYKNGQKIF